MCRITSEVSHEPAPFDFLPESLSPEEAQELVDFFGGGELSRSSSFDSSGTVTDDDESRYSS